MLRSGLIALVVLVSVLEAGCRRAASEPIEPSPTDETGVGQQQSELDPTQILAERTAVRETIEAYIAGAEARDPAAASELVTADTFDFYDDLRRLALAGTREQLEQRSLMVILIVLDMRVRLSAAELEQSDGRGLFERAIAEGLVGEDMRSLDLRDLWIDAAEGRAEVRVGEQPVLWLRREQERWKIDLPAMIAGLAPLLETAATEQIRRDGKLQTAYALLLHESPDFIDDAVLDGPLE